MALDVHFISSVMQVLLQDLRYGLRLLRGTPGFTAVAVLTLALGIGVNTSVFSWVNGLLLNPVPGTGNPGELAFIETFTGSATPAAHTSWRDYLDYRDHLTLVSGVAIGKHAIFSVGPEGKPERIVGEVVSGNYFSLLQVPMAAGRGFEEEEGRSAMPVAVISDNVWRRHFGRDPKAVGRTIRVNRHQLTVVGVAPPEFHGGTPGVVYDLWVPFPIQSALGVGGSLRYRATRDGTATFVRMRPGVTIDQVRSEVSALARRLAAAEPRTNAGVEATVLALAEGHNGAQGLLRGPLRILIAVGALVLLIVCANVANLLLARAVERQREFSIRLALGCGTGRLIRQILTETVMLAGAGTLAGLLMSLWMRDALEAFLPAHDLPISLAAPVDLTTFLFTAAVCLVTTVVCGVAPALLSVHTQVNDKLKESGRSDSAGAGSRSNSLRKLLIVSEVALASVALIGAALFVRSFANASSIHPGFDVNNVLVSRFYLTPAGYNAAQEIQFCRRLRDRLAQSPNVEEVSYADQTQLQFGNQPDQKVEVEGRPHVPGESQYVQRTLTGAGYFHLLRIPLLEGRDFTEMDTKESEQVMIVNQTFARQYFDGRNPVGRRVSVEGRWRTVVGMVKDSKYNSLTEPSKPYMYIKFDQYFSTGLPSMLYIRTRGNPENFLPTLRREVLALDPNAAAFYAITLSEATATALLSQRVAAGLLLALATMALVLAAVGLYGVMSYSVSRRTQELGIRMALGASSGDILRSVVWSGLTLTIAGAAAGVLLALALTRSVSGMLVDVSWADPVAFCAALVFLLPVAALATFIPARRATRLNPVAALRAE